MSENNDHVFSFSDGLARIKKSGYDQKKKKKKGEPLEFPEWAFIDKNFKEILSLKYFWIGDFKDGLAKFVGEGYRGFINKDGKEIIKISATSAYEDCEWIDDFEEGLARIKFNNGEMGYLEDAIKKYIESQGKNG